MKTNRTIRIIKGSERNNQSGVDKSQAAGGDAPQRPAAREAASNVATWVKEFRQRRPVDPRRAFASLFGEQTTPLNSLT